MSHILYVDDDEIAIRALQGIFKRSPHALTLAHSSEDAWKLICERIDFDMLILELKLKNENVWPIIKRIRANPFLGAMPILVYTAMKDRRAVRSILALDVQNYLFKPFKEHQLLEEIKRVEQADWRIEMSGNAQLFYSRLKVNVEDFHRFNVELMERLQTLYGRLSACSSAQAVCKYETEIRELAEFSEKQDYTILRAELNAILEGSRKGVWTKVQPRITCLANAITMQRYRLSLIEAKLPHSEAASEDKDAENVITFDEDEPEPCAEKLRYTPEQIEEKINAITDYPVVESAAAAFQMISEETEINLDEIVLMIERDPGLATAVLRFSNSSFVAPASIIEDIHQAISVLGLARVRLLAMSLRTVSEFSALFKAFRWQDFWAHQIGCAMLSEYIFSELELPGRPELAYLSGLISEMGKMLLCDIDTQAYRLAVKDARENQRMLFYCERDYFSCSHDHAGLLFAKISNLAPALQTAIAYKHKPSQANEYVEYVGCVSLASYLCTLHGVGESGDVVDPRVVSPTQHPGWELFSPWLAPNFSIVRFNRILESKAKSLKIELSGMAANHLT